MFLLCATFSLEIYNSHPSDQREREREREGVGVFYLLIFYKIILLCILFR